MEESTEHPLQRFWSMESGWWQEETPVPELGLSEGRLCIDTWNAAIEAAAACVVPDGNPVMAKLRIEKLHYSGATH